MVEIHIFRHGETEWNLAGRMQGFKDSSLTDNGKLQAIEARCKIENIVFDAAYCSTSSRAIDTAKILLNEQPTPINELRDLREINMGVWEGLKHTDVKKMYSAEHFNFWNRPSRFNVEHSESFLALATRSVAVIKKIIRKHQGQKILIVSHAGLIKTLLTTLQSRPLDQLWDAPFAENLSHSILIGHQNDRIHIKLFCVMKTEI